jgi:uncharacterized protein (DUF736 family)|uniref:Uncharacterized protein n=1 Tax=Caulobacter sp. (strain K31) TaxID=366602 RepID=B0T6S5_CAUSK
MDHWKDRRHGRLLGFVARSRNPAPSRAICVMRKSPPTSMSGSSGARPPPPIPTRAACAGVEVGDGWRGFGPITRPPYVGLSLCHPGVGPRAYKVNLGRAASQDDDDVFALIWNAED